MKYLKHNGYIGDINFSKEDNLYYGKIQGIYAIVAYDGKNLEELKEDFKEAIKSYEEDFETEKAIKSFDDALVVWILWDKAIEALFFLWEIFLKEEFVIM